MKEVRNIQSIERGFSILHCFIKGEELALAEISRRTELNKSTAGGIVTTLKNLKILDQNSETGKYRLGLGLYRLGSMVELKLKEIVMNELIKLSESTDETILLHAYTGGVSTTIIEVLESNRDIRYVSKIGNELNITTTAIGKSILSSFDDCRIESLIVNYADNEGLNDDIRKARETGYGVIIGQIEEGYIGVGVAIKDMNGKPIGGVGIAGPASRMNEEMIKHYGTMLLSISDQLKENIGSR